MLIKRVSQKSLPKGAEVRYMVTADIAEMAKLVGVHPERLLRLLSSDRDHSAPFYGNARPTAYFMQFAESQCPTRKLSLSQIDIRMQESYSLDASGSFIIMPLYVVRPEFVGDLENEDGVRYELIPNLMLTAEHMGRQQFYQYPNMAQPFRDLALELENNEGFEVNFTLQGFDLVMLPDDPEIHTHDPQEFLPDIRSDLMTQESVQRFLAMNQSNNVTYDYGFGVVGKYVYTADNKDCLRIDHYMHYQGRQLFRCEHDAILSPGELLARAVKYVNLSGQKETEFEAYEIMRVIRDSSDFHGIGYHNA